MIAHLLLAIAVGAVLGMVLGFSWGFGLGYERGRIEAVRGMERVQQEAHRIVSYERAVMLGPDRAIEEVWLGQMLRQAASVERSRRGEREWRI